MNLRTAIATIAAAMLAACAEDDYNALLSAPQEQAASDGIVFEASFSDQAPAAGFTQQDTTRFALNNGAAGATHFEQGDLVGIFLVRTETDLATIKAVADKTYDGTGQSPVVLANVPYQYQSDGRLLYWDGTQTGKLYWPSDNGYNNGLAAYTTYAYYPYKANTTIDAITGTVVNTDGTPNLDPATTNRIKPLLYSIASTPRLRLNTLSFHHALSIVEVKVRKTVGSYMPANENGERDHEALYFRGLKPDYSFNLFTGNITATSASGQSDTTQQCRMYRVERATTTQNYWTFRTLIPKQNIDFTNFDHLRIYYQDHAHTGEARTDGSYLTFGRSVNRNSGGIVALQQGQRHTLDFSTYDEIDSHFREKDRGGQNMMCEIPPGTYQRNGHTVTLTRYFQIGRNEVTNAQYCQFLNDNNIPASGIWTDMPQYMKTKIQEVASGNPTRYALISNTSGDRHSSITTAINTYGLQHNGTKWVPASGRDNYPVTDVNWYGAKCYCLYYGGDLPTDAEWELACRAGTTTTYYWGDAMNNNYCVWGANGGSHANTIMSKTPNARGLYDMAGNVLEWTNDYHPDPDTYPTADATDPTIPGTNSSDPTMTVRGGSYESSDTYCTSAIRIGHPSWARWDNMGFRIKMK